MRKALTALGVASTMLMCAQARANIVEITPVPSFTTFTGTFTGAAVETFNTMAVGSGPTFNPAFGGVYLGPAGTVQNGSPPGVAAAPAGDLTNYLAVTGSETILFTGSRNTFGLFWGSIDSWNAISFSGPGGVETYTFQNLPSPLTDGGSHTDPTQNAYVVFQNLPAFTSVTISSSQPAFELDNLEVNVPGIGSTVPETSTWMMMILGFFSLGFVAYRRKGKVMQLRLA
jgi:hypothetical protein